MTSFTVPGSGGVSLAYSDIGTGFPIVLVHGFASNRQTNWIGPGWFDALAADGRRVIALDVRGHGASSKPRDPAAYEEATLAADVLALLDHLRVPEADYMGYSMGGFIGVSALAQSPQRFRRAILAGVGLNYLAMSLVDPLAIAGALRAPALSALTDPIQRQFRRFAEASGNDLEALAACMLRPRKSLAVPDLRHVTRPVLVITGAHDLISGPPEPLAALFSSGEAQRIPLRDHMTAVGDKAYKAQVLAFLK
jgi:pimeloyl-ACP methyl ester carboxylesterase